MNLTNAFPDKYRHIGTRGYSIPAKAMDDAIDALIASGNRDLASVLRTCRECSNQATKAVLDRLDQVEGGLQRDKRENDVSVHVETSTHIAVRVSAHGSFGLDGEVRVIEERAKKALQFFQTYDHNGMQPIVTGMVFCG